MKSMRKIAFILVVAVLVIGSIVTAIVMHNGKEKGDDTKPEEVVKENKVVSMFSWYFDLTNSGVFNQLEEPLEELGITRVYQLLPAEYLREPEIPVMVKNLSTIGIETVLLTGDSSWLIDGLAEYTHIVDEIAAYNSRVAKEMTITEVALDIEGHSLAEWQQDPKRYFQIYIDLMKQAKEYANQHGIKVIQVIPNNYDDIDAKMFDTFLKTGCDEVSIMNYRKSTALTAIDTEVALCSEYDIPVETIFETMPISDEHDVTKDITYYYDGIDALKENVLAVKEHYGPALGIGYHHYGTIYEMCTGTYLAEIYPSEDSIDAVKVTSRQAVNPGNLLLMGADGSYVLATPYWPKRKGVEEEYCWLAVGVKNNMTYTIERYDLLQKVEQKTNLAFSIQQGEVRPKTTIAIK